ncbi:MAG TPA: hypothetical protein VE986_11060, partial [Hyphomicrobiales bacterium]|nr:hypothetical protein [Hyphomicrobiales bacterium]
MLKQNLITALIFFAVLLFIIGFYAVVRDRMAYRGRIRSRLTALKSQPAESLSDLVSLRNSRSLTNEGYYALALVSLNRLILQSGAKIGLLGVLAAALICAAIAFLISHLAGAGLFIVIPVAITSAIMVPFAAL